MEPLNLPCSYDLPLTGNGFCQYYAPHSVFHPGVDYNKGSGNQDCGNEVRAPRNGQVVFMNKKESTGRGYGIFIILKHDDGTYTRYAHLKDIAAPDAQKFNTAELLGHVGNTGTTYCHLHFEVFGEKLAEIQRKHTYPWCYYPVGLSEEWVRQHYVDPFVWLKAAPSIPDWAKPAIEKSKSSGIITDWSNPYRVVGDEKLEWILEKSGLLDPAKHEGKVTLLRLAVALEKGGKLNMSFTQ